MKRSELNEYIENRVKAILREEFGDPVQPDDQDPENYRPMEAIEYLKFQEILQGCGWSTIGNMDVENRRTGEVGVRYLVVPDNNKSCPFETLVDKITANADIPDGIIPGHPVYKYAPEQKHYSIVIMEG